jgi:hypothetical protein
MVKYEGKIWIHIEQKFSTEVRRDIPDDDPTGVKTCHYH